jgi:hypothetical protein
MVRFFFTFVMIFFFLQVSIYSQPLLKLYPDEIEFEDIFHRMQNVLFVNEGNETLVIDTIYYNSTYYFIRFDKSWRYPISIPPGDTLLMDCILTSFYQISQDRVFDTLFVLNNGIKKLEQIKIKIDYYDDDYGEGIIQGTASSNGTPVENADVYFLYDGNYIITGVQTDNNGMYSAPLPPGSYLVAVQKDSFYTSFYNQKYDPFNAAYLSLKDKETLTVNFELSPMQNTGISIQGRILDSLSISPLKRALVVSRKGNHTPTKPQNNLQNLPAGIYSTFTDYEGNYAIKNMIDEDYYYVQGFSDYYIPSFYKQTGSSVFWQGADSIYINSSLINRDIFLPRDSSVGGGIIKGEIIINSEENSDPNDAGVLALSLDYNLLFNHTFVDSTGSFTMRNLPFGNYRLVAQKLGFENAASQNISITSGVINIDGIILTFYPNSIEDKGTFPEKFILYQNYPNPFNPVTNVEFFLPKYTNVVLKVSNILGEEIALIHQGSLQRGSYKFSFDAGNFSSGAYLLSLSTENGILTRKIILLK